MAGEDAPKFQPGDRVNGFVIHQFLGEDRLADVVVADQAEPVERRVALKIIKPGLDTRAVIARFEARRRALTAMDHPNVARVFDAGVSADGRPYFVMEYVPGEAITDYCDSHRLNIRERLDLFVQACEGVQHAHQKGMIHQDIKPSNVLVTVEAGSPRVKVIDFGVAAAIDQGLTDKTLLTEQGQLGGAPEYLSPEQAGSGDVDTRADIYSLGVLLYELLVGALPFKLPKLGRPSLAEIQRIIREEEPDRPSTCLRLDGSGRSVAASHRRTNARGLARELRGDLDWITMKVLDKDRARRYSSASELVADIRHHLRNLPVLAGPRSAGYWISKLARRHTAGALATSLVAFVLLGGLIAATTFAVVQGRARADDAAEAVALLYDARQEWEHDADAERVLVLVVDILRRGGGEHATLVPALRRLASLYAGQKRFDEAEAALLEALARLEAAPEPDRQTRDAVAQSLAELYENWGRSRPGPPTSTQVADAQRSPSQK